MYVFKVSDFFCFPVFNIDSSSVKPLHDKLSQISEKISTTLATPSIETPPLLTSTPLNFTGSRIESRNSSRDILDFIVNLFNGILSVPQNSTTVFRMLVSPTTPTSTRSPSFFPVFRRNHHSSPFSLDPALYHFSSPSFRFFFPLNQFFRNF